MDRTRTEHLVKDYYNAFNAGDTDRMLSHLSEDIAHDVNQGQRRTGKAMFREFCAHMDRCYSERLEDIVVMTAPTGTRASAEFVVHGVYKNTDEGLPPAKGQTYVLPAGAFLDIQDGKITRITTYYNLQNWMEQVTGP